MDSDTTTELGSRAGALGRDEGRIDLPHEPEPPPADGDGGMLGRVLIYASIVAVVVVSAVWKRLS